MSFAPDKEEIDDACLRGDVATLRSMLETVEAERLVLQNVRVHELVIKCAKQEALLRRAVKLLGLDGRVSYATLGVEIVQYLEGPDGQVQR